MGRKKKAKVGTFDRIGEKVNLDKCPECIAHPDCFAWMEGKCTALSTCSNGDCPFFKSVAQAEHENRQSYQVLKKNKRYDLIEKYRYALMSLGAFDSEFANFEESGVVIEMA